ncbi:FIG00455408: hypothetical protein [plant metagenome]|uniref:Chromosome partitioning protein ParB n=1 Tax=plant metagenome TaxID=1297885 RepID=A0A484Q8L1_9ZZZZ
MPQQRPACLSLPVRKLLAGLILPIPLLLAACGGSDNDEPVADGTPVTPPATEPETPPLAESPYLKAVAGDLLEVAIEELKPTQAAIGYDQIYYKLGRWQPDFTRPTWAANDAQQLVYLNRTVGKKFDDFCEDTGRGERAQPFQTLAEAGAARLDDPSTFACRDEPGTDDAALKTVVVGPEGVLYLTDGHHGFSSLYEIADGGPKLKVWVKVSANYSDAATQAEFWQRMVDSRQAWLRDTDNQPITPEQLPTRVGLLHDDRPGGMAEDRYRSLVYFTRGIAYDNGGLPEFAEFYWGDWMRQQTTAGNLKPFTDYRTGVQGDVQTDVLAQSTLNSTLQPGNSNTSYSAMVRDAALRMTALADTDVVSGERTAAELGRIVLVSGAPNPSLTKRARDELEELARNDVNGSGNSRGAGKLWFAINYRYCGAPATGTCWGW